MFLENINKQQSKKIWKILKKYISENNNNSKHSNVMHQLRATNEILSNLQLWHSGDEAPRTVYMYIHTYVDVQNNKSFLLEAICSGQHS